MNERTDTSSSNLVSILQAIDIPTKSRMLAAKIHMHEYGKKLRYNCGEN
jgi:hypothetical protein